MATNVETAFHAAFGRSRHLKSGSSEYVWRFAQCRTCRLLGRSTGQRPNASDISIKSQPSSPSSASSLDSLDRVIRSHSSFTRYLGGQFLTLYSVTVFISSMALIALAVTTFVIYQDKAEQAQLDYMSSAIESWFTIQASTFLSAATHARELMQYGATALEVMNDLPSFQSMFEVSNDPDQASFYHSRSGTSVLTTSTAADCVSSTDYGCMSDGDVAEVSRLESLIGTFSSPQWTGSPKIVTYLWQQTPTQIIQIQLSPFEFEVDSFGSSGWLVDGTTGNVVSMTNSPLPTCPLATRQVIKSSGTTIVVSPMSELSPFVIIAESPSYQSPVYWLLIASIAVSCFPVVGTLMIGAGYALRSVAVRRKKQQRMEELRDAQQALELIRKSRQVKGAK